MISPSRASSSTALRAISRPTGGQRGLREHDEHVDAGQAWVGVSRAFEPLGERERGVRVALVECELDLSQTRDEVELCLCEQRPRLVEAALPATQLSQSCCAFHECGAAAAREHLQRACQLRLGLAPCALLKQHRGVLRPAGVEQRAQLPALRERLDLGTPLGRALDVADPLAGRDQVAAHLSDPHQVIEFAGGGGHRRLVQPAHPSADVALLHEREPLERARNDLDVLMADLGADGDRAADSGKRALRLVRVQGDLRLAHRKPGVLRAYRLILEQASRPAEPAAGDRGPPAEQERVPGKRGRDARCTNRVTRGTIETVGPLAGCKRRVGIVQPPLRDPDPLEGVGIVVEPFEVLERLVPPPRRERLPASGAIRHPPSIAPRR